MLKKITTYPRDVHDSHNNIYVRLIIYIIQDDSPSILVPVVSYNNEFIQILEFFSST